MTNTTLATITTLSEEPIAPSARVRRRRSHAFSAKWIGTAALASILINAGLSGCNDPDPSVRTDHPPGPGQSSASADATAVPQTRARVTTVSSSLVVEHVPTEIDRLRRAVRDHDGYVEEATLSGGADRYATLDARVPSARLDAFRDALEAGGEIESNREQVRDVTDQLTDTAARLRNAAAHENRLLELLSERTGSLEDVLAVESELARVRESIERMEAGQLTLEREVAYARIQIELRSRDVPFWESPRATVIAAGTRGMEAAAAVTVGIVAVAAAVGPTSAIAVGGLLAIFLLFRTVRGVRRRWDHG